MTNAKILWLATAAIAALINTGCRDEIVCAAGTVRHGNQCVADGSGFCAAGTTFDADTGECEPDIGGCATGTTLNTDTGECEPDIGGCATGTTLNTDTGECEPDIGGCATGTVLQGAECIPDGSVICATGTAYNAKTGKCDPDISGCATGTVLVGDSCVPYDDTLVGDVLEPDEPNGFDGTAGSFVLPEIDASTTISGCVTPYEDADDNGNLDPDYDLYQFSIDGKALIEVTVDGIGGLAGAFLVTSLDEQLFNAGWQRLGVNLTNDTSQRQVFLPKAGTYTLAITDGRSLIIGEGAGDAETCYFVTVRQVGLPTPTAFASAAQSLCEDGVTSCSGNPECAGIGSGRCRPTLLGTLEGEVRFVSFDPNDGDLLSLQLSSRSEALVPALSIEVNGSVASVTDAGSAGSPADGFVAGLGDSDSVVIAVDDVYNMGLVAADTLFTIDAPGATLVPSSGSVNVTYVAGKYDWLYFPGNAGDVVHLTASTPANLACNVVDAISGTVLAAASLPYDGWIQLTDTRFYYLSCYNSDAQDYTLNLTRAHAAPTPITIGTSIHDAVLTADNVTWFELDVAPADWLVFGANPANFDGDLRVGFYSRTNAGEVGSGSLPQVDGFSVPSSDTAHGRIVVSDSSRYLIGISDDGNGTPGVLFDFSVTDRAFTDLGMLSPSTPLVQTNVPIAAGVTQDYLARVDPIAVERVEIIATGDGAVTSAVALLDATEAQTSTAANGSTLVADSAVLAPGWIAFRVSEGAGQSGTFGLEVVAIPVP